MAAPMTIAHDYQIVAPSAAPAGHVVPDHQSYLQRAARIVRLWVKYRIVQFALLGGLIFAVSPRPRLASTIEMRSERLSALRMAEASRSSAKTLTEAEAHAVDQRALEDEILYREGIRLGLDKNDGIVRQRVVQKVLFLAEEMAGTSRPADDASLHAFFATNQQRWSIPEKFHFVQIYGHQRQPLASWVEGSQRADPPLSEPSPVAPDVNADHEQIAKSFGADFAAALEGAPNARWSGPLHSAFGWHLVKMIDRSAPRLPEFNEVKSAVAEAFSVYRRQEATAEFLQNAFARYQVKLDGKTVSNFTPSRRLAFRAVSSGED